RRSADALRTAACDPAGHGVLRRRIVAGQSDHGTPDLTPPWNAKAAKAAKEYPGPHPLRNRWQSGFGSRHVLASAFPLLRDVRRVFRAPGPDSHGRRFARPRALEPLRYRAARRGPAEGVLPERAEVPAVAPRSNQSSARGTRAALGSELRAVTWPSPAHPVRGTSVGTSADA